jgi:hypothetical protein
VRNGEDADERRPDSDSRVLECDFETEELGPGEFCYIRVTTRNGNMAWGSPFWSEQERSS